MLLTLYDAEDKNLLSDPTAGLLAELFIEYLIAPHTDETLEVSKDHAFNFGQSSFQFLIATLRAADDKGVLPDSTSELFADLFIEYLIAPHTGETAEGVRDRILTSVSSTMDDRAALVTLYESTDGDNWTDNANWLSDKPIGQWYGVEIDVDTYYIRMWSSD